MPYATVNDARINYVQLGPEGQHYGDIVLVHGLATNLAFWYFQYAEVLAERYRVTLFDLRGHGRSTTTARGYRAQDLAADLETLLAQLGIRWAHVAGHSFGGVVALSFAQRRPDWVASLVLADAQTSMTRRALSGRAWPHGEVLRERFARYRISLDPQDPFFGFRALSELARLVSEEENPPEELLRLVSPMLGKPGARTAKKWLRLLATTEAERELQLDDGLTPESMSTLKCPILALYGARSQAFLTSACLREALPHADVRSIDGAGHFFPGTHVEETLATLLTFWGRDVSSWVTTGSADHRERPAKAARESLRLPVLRQELA